MATARYDMERRGIPESGLPDGSPAVTRGYRRDGELQVPFRRIVLSDGEPAVDVYDTSGPLASEAGGVLPRTRQPWIERRMARDGRYGTQMQCARRGEVTEEMRFVALREGIAPERVRDEVASGRAIIPANLFPTRITEPTAMSDDVEDSCRPPNQHEHP